MATVYLGTWINWTDGRILGSTLTVTSRAGAYLIAFLALFVRIAGGHLWTIIAYLTFLYRSKAQDQDIYYHQQQAVLRNTVTEMGAILGLVKIASAWRKDPDVQRPYRRAAPILMVAAFHVAAFLAAGIFSSKVTSARSEVLIRGPICGTWALRSENVGYIARTPGNEGAESSSIADSHSNLISASNQVASCNISSPLAQEICLSYGPQPITFSIDRNISCPFVEEMCINQLAVRFDSGLLDSQLHLGINAPPSDRTSYRRVLTCAPIVTENFTSDWKTASELNVPLTYAGTIAEITPEEGFKAYRYGPTTSGPQSLSATMIYSNLVSLRISSDSCWIPVLLVFFSNRSPQRPLTNVPFSLD